MGTEFDPSRPSVSVGAGGRTRRPRMRTMYVRSGGIGRARTKTRPASTPVRVRERGARAWAAAAAHERYESAVPAECAKRAARTEPGGGWTDAETAHAYGGRAVRWNWPGAVEEETCIRAAESRGAARAWVDGEAGHERHERAVPAKRAERPRKRYASAAGERTETAGAWLDAEPANEHIESAVSSTRAERPGSSACGWTPRPRMGTMDVRFGGNRPSASEEETCIRAGEGTGTTAAEAVHEPYECALQRDGPRGGEPKGAPGGRTGRPPLNTCLRRRPSIEIGHMNQSVANAIGDHA